MDTRPLLLAALALATPAALACSSTTGTDATCEHCAPDSASALDSGASGLDVAADSQKADAATDAIRTDGTTTDSSGTDAPGTDASSTDASSSSDYASTGPYAVTKTDATVSGNAVHVLWPATPSGTTRSAVVFAHGFQLKTTDYDLLLSHIASWGYVVVSTDYPGSLFSIDHRDARDALIKAKDALVAGSIAGIPTVDAKKIAASGHSLGGKASIMAVLADPAFVAALAFDPVDGNPSPTGGTADAAHPTLVPTETAKLAVPVGYFGATQSRCVKSAFGPACAPEGADAAAFFGGTPTTLPRALWTIFDFGHMQFLDGACGFACTACADGKGDLPARHSAIQAIAVAFLQRHVDGVAAAQSFIDGAKRDAYVTAGVLWDGVAAKPACP